MADRTLETEHDKDQLRQLFVEFGSSVALKLTKLGHFADPFDPRTGLPMISPPGCLKLDDVAIAHQTLGYPVIACGSCSLILHPTWKTAVYPSTLLSSAHPYILEQITNKMVERFWAQQNGKVLLPRY